MTRNVRQKRQTDSWWALLHAIAREKLLAFNRVYSYLTAKDEEASVLGVPPG